MADTDVRGILWEEEAAQKTAKREAHLNLIRVFGEDCTLKQLYMLKESWMNRSAHGRIKILREACPGIYNTEDCFMNRPLDELHIPNEQKFGYFLSIEQAQAVVNILRAGNLDKYR